MLRFEHDTKPAFLITLCVTLILIFNTSYAEERYALIIGNANYEIGPLKNAKNDARDISIKLETLGFDVTTYFDVNLNSLEHAIEEFYHTITSKTAVTLFYYAGHAMQINNINYLIPVNAKITSLNSMNTEAISFNVLLDSMRLAKSRTNIIVLDACRNNPFSGFLPEKEDKTRSTITNEIKKLKGGLANIDAPPGTLIAYATEPGKVAQDGAGENGTYTKYLLQYLDEPVGIEKLFKFVRSGVMRETNNQQIPWEHSSLYKDFYFRRDEASELPNIPSF